MIRNPRKAYPRLFGTQEVREFRNITDLVLEDARSLRKELGQADRHKFGENFDSIRTIEEQLDKLEKLKGKLKTVSITEPPEARLPRGAYIRLMCDLMVVAFEAGLKRVAALIVGLERWNTPFMFEGLFEKPVSHHLMSHEQMKCGDQVQQIDRFYMHQ